MVLGFTYLAIIVLFSVKNMFYFFHIFLLFQKVENVDFHSKNDVLNFFQVKRTVLFFQKPSAMKWITKKCLFSFQTKNKEKKIQQLPYCKYWANKQSSIASHIYCQIFPATANIYSLAIVSFPKINEEMHKHGINKVNRPK